MLSSVRIFDSLNLSMLQEHNLVWLNATQEIEMNYKWKWIVSITRAVIILLIPLLVLAMIFQDGGNGILGLRTMFPAWLIMIAWVLLIVFGFSEEG
jgi:hypothetical protein